MQCWEQVLLALLWPGTLCQVYDFLALELQSLNHQVSSVSHEGMVDVEQDLHPSLEIAGLSYMWDHCAISVVNQNVVKLSG